jgi:hypothetical protein
MLLSERQRGLFPLWMLTDDLGTSELFATLADCLIAQTDLTIYGVKTAVRLLEVTDNQSPTIH